MGRVRVGPGTNKEHVRRTGWERWGGAWAGEVRRDESGEVHAHATWATCEGSWGMAHGHARDGESGESDGNGGRPTRGAGGNRAKHTTVSAREMGSLEPPRFDSRRSLIP